MRGTMVAGLMAALLLRGGAQAQWFDDVESADVESPPASTSSSGSSGGSTGGGGTTFRDCAQCPEMVVVSAGSFMMGSPASEAGRRNDEGPQHSVSVGRFALGRTEVTFAEFDACGAAGGCSHRPDDSGWGRGDRPVIDVSWHDAQEYVSWLSRTTGRLYRLPSEAEWEYAARAGTTTAYYWGEEIGVGWAHCYGCGSLSAPQWDFQTAPVGSFAANGFGLHDMLGNVYEWVQDCWNGNYSGAPTTGVAWESGDCSRRVLRGGSWIILPDGVRSAYRFWYEPDYRNDLSGFRVALTY